MRNHDSVSVRTAALLPTWLGYVAFVIYGSLLPFAFRPLALGEAWVIFQHTPMFKLGVESRADWIANGVLYVPVGFLTVQLLRHRLAPAGAMILAGFFSSALAVGVEFTQIFFPPRTVSLNDILAEIIGSGVGLLLAAHLADWLRKFAQARFGDHGKLVQYGFEAFFAGYVAFSLFPYDILLSADELARKLHGTNWGWLLAGASGPGIQSIFKLVAEVLVTLPFGLYLGFRAGARPISQALAAALGALLGAFIEIAQFFIASGVCQGASILTRIAGTCGGLALWRHRADLTPDRLAVLVRRYALPLAFAYLAALLTANGWFSNPWRGFGHAASQLEKLNFLPFYYHYYTTEARALFSLASVFFTYVPIGVMIWANRGSAALALWVAVACAAIVEAGKLFVQGVHPDPTNLLIAATAAWGAVHAVTIAARTIVASARPAQAPPQEERALPAAARAGQPLLGIQPADFALLLPIAGFCFFQAATFPAWPVLVCLLLALCALVVWQRPALALLIIPLALPVFDLAPWSGRFYLDEFDVLVLLLLAIGFARVPAAPSRLPANRPVAFALWTFLGSLALASLIALFPWQSPGDNAFNNYFSAFNALRIGKGALWAMLCLALIRRLHARQEDALRPLALGMTAGLAATVAVVVWERITFASLHDFSSDYRVTGPISAMHTGGAYIECFIAVATPFLLLLILQTRSWLNRALGVLLLLVTTYALMVTYSRNGYAAFAAAAGLFLLLAALPQGGHRWRGIMATALAALVLAAAVPVFSGQFAQQRLAHVERDLDTRMAHWSESLALRPTGWATSLFGAGLGRFPEMRYLFGAEKNRTGSYQLRSEQGNAFLRLTSGAALYIEQIVPVEPRQTYRLQFRARSNVPNGTINLSLCEKWMLTSFDCRGVGLDIGDQAGVWTQLEAPLGTFHQKPAPWYARRTVKLSLHTPAGASRFIDIDDIRVQNAKGDDLVQNGNFSAGMDHWFFSTDHHLQWHAKSLPVALLFEQGWFGLFAFAVFAAVALKRLVARAWSGDLSAAAASAALLAFLVVGLFDTLIDAPRFLFLLVLFGGMGAARGETG